MKTVISSIFLASALFSLAASVPAQKMQLKNPMSTFKSCNVTLPKRTYNKCMEEAIQNSIVSLKDGYRPNNIKAFEPFVMSKVYATSSYLNQTYTNVKVHGLTKGLQIKNFKLNAQTLDMEVEAYNPQVDFLANHQVNGTLVFPINGHGNCNISMHHLKTNAKIHCSKVHRNGNTYLQVNKFTVSFNPRQVVYYFSTFFSGKDEGNLTQVILNVLNDPTNTQVFEDQKPGFEAAFGKEFRDLSNQIFSRIPFNTIFPGIKPQSRS